MEKSPYGIKLFATIQPNKQHTTLRLFSGLTDSHQVTVSKRTTEQNIQLFNDMPMTPKLTTIHTCGDKSVSPDSEQYDLYKQKQRTKKRLEISKQLMFKEFGVGSLEELLNEREMKEKQKKESYKDFVRGKKDNYNHVESKLKQQLNSKPNIIQENLNQLVTVEIKDIKDQDLQNDNLVTSIENTLGKSFISQIKPQLKSFQKRYNPAGASMNKTPILLRNTFNLELFRFFHQKNKEKQELKKQQDKIKVQSAKADIQKKKALRIQMLLLKMLEEESGKMNVEYFKQLENKLPLSERTVLEQKKQELVDHAQQKLSKKDFQATLLKKNQLELKLFKLKTGRIAKIFANTVSSPKEKPQISVFNENFEDARSIPANEYLFKNFIAKAMQEQERIGWEYDIQDIKKALVDVLEFWDDQKIQGFSLDDQIRIKKAYRQVKMLERDSKVGSLRIDKNYSESLLQKLADPESQKIIKLLQNNLKSQTLPLIQETELLEHESDEENLNITSINSLDTIFNLKSQQPNSEPTSPRKSSIIDKSLISICSDDSKKSYLNQTFQNLHKSLYHMQSNGQNDKPIFNLVKLDKIVSDCDRLYKHESTKTQKEFNQISNYLTKVQDTVLKPENNERGFHVLNKRRKQSTLNPADFVTTQALENKRMQLKARKELQEQVSFVAYELSQSKLPLITMQQILK